MTAPHDTHSISELVANALAQLGKLVDDEIRLARAELSQKLGQVRNGAVLLAAAMVFVIPTLVVLFIGIAMFLTRHGLSGPAAYLLVAVAGGVVSSWRSPA